ncbi:dihydropteroate synthase [Acaryochloris sp. IP29b_bin.148]|uniref:dihydropteroate synthase n=1 Tax=Acaryochloris sp. IP29b_bin.148 TaxID=2969218 RepID=UPI0026305869|nr:dihydropteroate synthase [Acaryochloris sp. IP29b_bin.148]
MTSVAPAPPWTLREHTFHWGTRTYLMGILNVTPDSFSDGGQFNSRQAAVEQAHHLVQAGMDILDIGGQSTRPQAVEVPEAEERERVIPVIQAIRTQLSIPISVDTTRASVAEAAIAAGADLVNDVSGGIDDPKMLPIVAKLKVPIILMHRRGTPQTMQQLTDYDNLLEEIIRFLDQQIHAALAAGISPDHLAIDPGIGFAKTGPQNLELLRQLPQLQRLHCPILVGPSRKSFIGHILNQPDPQKRVWGTAAACCAAIQGGADLLRIHDGAAMREVCQVADAIWR